MLFTRICHTSYINAFMNIMWTKSAFYQKYFQVFLLHYCIKGTMNSINLTLTRHEYDIESNC